MRFYKLKFLCTDRSANTVIKNLGIPCDKSDEPINNSSTENNFQNDTKICSQTNTSKSNIFVNSTTYYLKKESWWPI